MQSSGTKINPGSILESYYKKPLYIILIFIWCLTSSCALKSGTGGLVSPDIPSNKEILRLEKKLKNQKDPAVTSPAATSNDRFRLALLYSHHKNPAPDFARAENLIKEYIKLNPDDRRLDDATYLLSLLQEINKTKQDCNEILQKENAKLKNENNDLSKENQKMKGIIEELKSLDIRLEEKRQHIE